MKNQLLEYLIKPKSLPTNMHGENWRKILKKSSWDKIRKLVYERAENKCEMCFGVGKKHKVECHEIWMFDLAQEKQYLERLIALCPNCHRVQHALLLKMLEDQNKINSQYVINHLNKKFNQNYTYQSFYSHANEFSKKLENIQWNIDLIGNNDQILISFLKENENNMAKYLNQNNYFLSRTIKFSIWNVWGKKS